MISKRWIRRNRHVNPDLVKAVIQHQRWPSYKITRRHPITGLYLAIDTRCLDSKSYRDFLKQSYKEQLLLQLYELDIATGDYNLKSEDKDLIDKIKKLLIEDDIIDLNAEIKDED
jgi:hypothetical protein